MLTLCLCSLLLDVLDLYLLYFAQRIPQLLTLLDDLLSDQFLDPSLLGGEAEAREHEEIEVGGTEIEGAVQVEDSAAYGVFTEGLLASQLFGVFFATPELPQIDSHLEI